MVALAVEVLGSSGSYASAGGACSGYLIHSAGARVWLDAGPGTLANLQRSCALGDLGAIVLSHAHPDHWLELPVLANALEWYEPRPPLRVVSNAHTFGEARALIGAPVSTVFDWQVVEPGVTVEIADQTWSFAEAEHYVPTMATLCRAGGRSIYYSADTGPGFSLDRFGPDPRRIDLGVVESTFLDRVGHEGVLHLSASEAATIATGRIDRLVLTHQAPHEDRAAHLTVAAEIFEGPVELAEVGRVYAAGD